MAFRLRFSDWHDIITVDYTITPQMIENRKKESSVMTHIIYINKQIIKLFIIACPLWFSC